MLKNIAKLNALEMSRRYPTFKPTDVDHLREWLDKTPHLPSITDYEIFLFLHAAEFSVECTKIRIDKFYTIRTRVKVLFEDRDVGTEEFRVSHEDYACFVLPKPLPDKRRVVVAKIMDPTRFNYKSMLKVSSLIFNEIEIYSNADDISEGLVFLNDVEHSRLSHLMQVDIMLNKQMIAYAIEACPEKISELHFINAPSHMERIMTMIKPCVSKDFASRVFVHSKKGEVPSFIPKDYLPKDYGGTLKSIKELNEENYQILLKNRDFFLEEAKCRRVNERLRRGKIPYSEALFGLEGNFRKLDID